MEVSLLYFDGCPNHHEAESQLLALLDEFRWEGQIHKLKVDTPELAEELKFQGSPTVLVDGVDPFRDESAPVGLTCRVYRTSSGHQGTPPVDELRAAVDTALQGHA